MIDGLLPLSWSRIDTFLRCPRRFYIERVLGEKQPETPAMLLGKAVHEALETWVRTGDNEKALEKIDMIEDYDTARMRYYSGRSLLKGFIPRAIELKFGLTYNLKPTDFFADDCFFRGVVDLVTKTDYGLEIYDYKSGWSKPDPRQIFAYAMALHRFDKKINRAGFILLASHEIIDFEIGEDELETAARVLYKVYNDLDSRETEDDFPKNLEACGYCPFRQKCLEEGDDFETKLNNAYLMNEEAKEIMDKARKIVKETGEPIQITENTAYGPVETMKLKVVGKKEERVENEKIFMKWLLENHPEYLNISPSTPEDLELPPEIKALVQWKPSITVKMTEHKKALVKEA